MKRFFWTLLLCLVGVGTQVSDTTAAVRKQTERNAVELSAVEDETYIRVLMKIEPQNGWQIYSHTPGEIGQPTMVIWNLHNHQLLDEEWSAGEDILYEGFGLNVYRRPALYSARLLKAVGDMPDLQISWMACNGECVPESLSFRLTPEVFSLAFSEKEQGMAAKVPTQAIFDHNKSTDGRVWDEMLTKNKRDVAENDLWFNVLLLAFGGGVILNFMPCVFPVLFIKIMAIAKQKHRRKNVVEALQYSGGILVCFTLMAALLHRLRAAGVETGWGFQLQSPYFVGAMAILFLVLALMFLDIIRLNWSLKYLPAGAFMTGFLAVLIASPCTAPFMGAAVGWALTTERPASFYYPVFWALGAGYALPFFIAGLYPKFLQRILPKPGKWMDVLKKMFALPMLATCVWLLWILWGDTSRVHTLWQPYEQTEVETALQNGDKVLLNFTAKWCITCLVNEKAVFSGDEFAKLAQANNVRLFKADWTNHNPEIAEALAQYGRQSIPLYVYYNGRGEYVLLPQLVTIGTFRKLFARDNAATEK